MSKTGPAGQNVDAPSLRWSQVARRDRQLASVLSDASRTNGLVLGRGSIADVALVVVMRELSFAEKQRLARALGAVPVMANPDTRRLVVNSLPSHIAGAIGSYPAASIDMFAMVRTIVQYPKGFAELLEILTAMSDAKAESVGRLRQIAIELGLTSHGCEDR